MFVLSSRRTSVKPVGGVSVMLYGRTAMDAIITSTETVFAGFAMMYLGEKIRWNHLAAFACILAAVAFTFLPKE